MILLSSLIIGHPIIQLDEIDSTNDYASKMLNEKDEIADGTVIWAKHQTKGKGQFNAKWLTEKEQNLTFSIVLKPKGLHIKHQFYLTVISSLSIHFVLSKFGLKPKIKWPNDIYIGRNKVAGMLIQNTLVGQQIQSSIIGIGLNVNQKIFDPSIPNPTSMSLELGKLLDLNELIQVVFDCFEGYYLDLKGQNFSSLLSVYKTSLYQKDQVKSYQLTDGAVVNGIIRDVDESGFMKVELEDSSIRSFSLKEIRFL